MIPNLKKKEKNFLNSWKLIGKNNSNKLRYQNKSQKKRKNGVLYNEIFQ